jgi:hypothetical protein
MEVKCVDKGIDTRKKKGWRDGFPRWWWLVMVLLAGSSLVASWYLWHRFPTCMEWGLDAIKKPVPGAWLLTVTVYFIGLSFGWLVQRGVQFLFNQLTTLELAGRARDEALHRPNAFPSTFVGFVEGVLYPTSLLANRPEIVAAWLVFKVASAWKNWEMGHEGRRVFNRYLVGNGVSIGMGSLTYLALKVFVFC